MDSEPRAAALADEWSALFAGLLAWGTVATLVALSTRPLVALMLTGVVILALVRGRRDVQKVRSLAAARTKEDIGTFARAFDRRGAAYFDPWVIRAVWTTLQSLHPIAPLAVPLRPTDRLYEDLAIDSDDLEDVLPDVVARCGRATDVFAVPDSTPMGIRTVGDLVQWICTHRAGDHAPPRALPDPGRC
jgi:hypothetical protein